jgi:hypothetical protein
MDMVVVNKVIRKYQTATCEQLRQERAQGQGKRKPQMELAAIQMLRQDPQMQQAFFNQIAAPVVNKMFEWNDPMMSGRLKANDALHRRFDRIWSSPSHT